MTINVTTTREVRTDWVPVEACTLPTADQPLRLAEFEELFASGLHGAERLESTWLRLRLSNGPGVEERARDLAAREKKCCDFFDFAVHRAGHETVLDVRVPAAHAVVLDGAQQAAEAQR